MPCSSHARSSSSPVVKMALPSPSAATSAIERSISASSTTKPPPTENMGRRTSSSPSPSRAEKVIPLECWGRKVSGWSTMAEGRRSTASRPPRSRPPSASIWATRSRPTIGSTLSGSEPSRPMTTASRVPCPVAVAASDPYRCTSTWATRGPICSSSSTSRANWAAARIGPTVCELEGPIPISNRSNVLMLTVRLLDAGCGTGHRSCLARHPSRGRPCCPCHPQCHPCRPCLRGHRSGRHVHRRRPAPRHHGLGRGPGRPARRPRQCAGRDGHRPCDRLRTAARP